MCVLGVIIMPPLCVNEVKLAGFAGLFNTAMDRSSLKS